MIDRVWDKKIIVLIIYVISLFASNALAFGSEKLVFLRQDNVWIANTDGTGENQLTFSGQAYDPKISPDGKVVAFCLPKKIKGIKVGQIYLMPSIGGIPKKLDVQGIQGMEAPSFSPDGKSLVLVGMSDIKTKEEVFKGEKFQVNFAIMSVVITNLKTGEAKKIISNPEASIEQGSVYANPAFSPDGKWIVYQQSRTDVSGGFVVIDRKGRTVFQFPKVEEGDAYWRPVFSRDGKKILCYSPRNGPIYVVDLARGTKKELIDEGADPILVDNGKAIVYERWSNRWDPEGEPKPSSDLWRLDLAPGAKPKKILPNASFASN